MVVSNQERIDRIRAAGTAKNTIRAYESDLRYFWGWAHISQDLGEYYPVSSKLIEDFILDHVEGLDPVIDQKMIGAGIKKPGKHAVITIHRKLKALGWMHRHLEMENPARSDRIKSILTDAKRAESKAGRVPKQSRAITKPILNKMISSIDTRTLIGKRNRAILEFGFYTGGRRRSEIAGAEYRFLTPYKGGFLYNLHRSKTDQIGQGRKKILRRKYAGSLKSWIAEANITDGYLFRSFKQGEVTENPIDPSYVNDIIKKHIEIIKEDPTLYSAHGLRRGFITHCGRLGIPITDVMQLTDHKDIKTLITYYEEGKISQNQATRI